MRLKRYVEFGLLEIGQRIWLRLGQPEYEIHVRQDHMMPNDDDIVFEVLYKDRLFATTNLGLLVKRFQANGFKIQDFYQVEYNFYVDEQRQTSLYKLRQKIHRIVCKEYKIISYSRRAGMHGWTLGFESWPDDLELIRSEVKNILGDNVVEFILIDPSDRSIARKL